MHLLNSRISILEETISHQIIEHRQVLMKLEHIENENIRLHEALDGLMKDKHLLERWKREHEIQFVEV